MSLRFTNSDVVNWLSDNSIVSKIFFVEANFNAGDIRLHTGIGDKRLNGNLYKGVGEIMRIGQVSEEHGTNPNRQSVQMLFKDNSVFADLMNNDPVGRSCTIYLGIYDVETQQLKESITVYQGDMDKPTIKDMGSHFQVTIPLTNFFEIWSKAVTNSNWSHESHIVEHPGDNFFNQMESLALNGIGSEIPGKPMISGSVGKGAGSESETPEQRR